MTAEPIAPDSVESQLAGIWNELASLREQQQEILEILASASRALNQAQAYLPMLNGMMGGAK